MPDDRDLAAYDYRLPAERIAQRPLRPRDRARLMVVDGRELAGPSHHAHVYELPRFLRRGDCLVFNDTRVLPCRLQARRQPTGGRVEVLLLHRRRDGAWQALTRPARKAPQGQELDFGRGRRAWVTEEGAFGERCLRFDPDVQVLELMEADGELPVPPYIGGQPERPGWYQTIYARSLDQLAGRAAAAGGGAGVSPGQEAAADGQRLQGSAAAPTAGLHFTAELMARLDALGVRRAFVTLHVGLGTFQPIRSQRIDEHELHREYRIVSQQAADTIAASRRDGGRVIAVGTTSVRTLESAAAGERRVAAAAGWTDLYIRPGYRFQVVDGLVTNFHLPRSSLLVLVAALMGRERVLAAYRQAVAREYRFYSYGDAMLLLPGGLPQGPGRQGTGAGAP